MSADEMKKPEGIAPEILAAALKYPPEGEAEEDLGCDAYALWAAMTRLAHEVKLQGRAFAALREQVTSLCRPDPGLDTESLEAKIVAVVDLVLKTWQENQHEAERGAEAARRRATRAEEELLTTLADVYDRLSRALEASRRSAARRGSDQGWLRRWLASGSTTAGDEVRSLIEGQELALRRVADELMRRGLREITVLGQRFNPETMRAVATDSISESPEGTVTAVIRGGWMLGDALWRAAEVMVARR